MRIRTLAAVLICVALTACQGLKEALTAHTDTVARTASQELPVTRLANLLGKTVHQVDLTKENAEMLSMIWADYHRVAYAAAHNDSLIDKIDVALSPIFNSERVMRYQDSMHKAMKIPPASEATYAAGDNDLLAARHILFSFPDGATEAQKEEVRKKARTIRPQITAANFAEMAKKYSGDPGSKDRGGELDVFTKKTMVPEFGQGTAALKPGDISPPIETQYGVHVIQRRAYADVKAAYDEAFRQIKERVADSAMREDLTKEFDIKVKPGAGAVVKAAVKSEAQHRKSKDQVSTFKGGEMTVSEFLQWLNAIPPMYRVKEQLVQAPDSMADMFVKQMALQEIYLKKANDAKIDVTEQEKQQYRTQFKEMISRAQQELGVSPQQLADSAKSTSDKEKLGAARVDGIIDRFMAGQGQPVQIAQPLRAVLDAKYDVTVNSAGLDRAVEEAKKIRAAADSAMGASMPPSNIPMPPGPGGAPPPPPGGKKPPL